MPSFKFQFSGESPLTTRARCAAYRYYPYPLGIVTAVQISVCRAVPADNASLIGRQVSIRHWAHPVRYYSANFSFDFVALLESAQPATKLPRHCEPFRRMAWQSPGTTERYERQNNRRTVPRQTIHRTFLWLAAFYREIAPKGISFGHHVASHSDAPRNDSGCRYPAVFILLLI